MRISAREEREDGGGNATLAMPRMWCFSGSSSTRCDPAGAAAPLPDLADGQGIAG